jgi:phosphoribosyl 1,2-cyclic phosphodiesterase
LARHEKAFGAKRVILTHMSREMLAHAAEVPQQCAEDGMVMAL